VNVGGISLECRSGAHSVTRSRPILQDLSYIVRGDYTAVFVDARTPEEFKSKTVHCAVNVQAGEAVAANDDGRLPKWDKGTRVVVFANSAADAKKVAAEIATKAYWNSSYFSGSFTDLRRARLLKLNRRGTARSTVSLTETQDFQSCPNSGSPLAAAGFRARRPCEFIVVLNASMQTLLLRERRPGKANPLSARALSLQVAPAQYRASQLGSQKHEVEVFAAKHGGTLRFAHGRLCPRQWPRWGSIGGACSENSNLLLHLSGLKQNRNPNYPPN